MDFYQKAKCIQGLVIGMDEQIYQMSQKHDLSTEQINQVAKYFIDAIKEQLGFLNEKERVIKELHKQGLISENDKSKLLNNETPCDIKILDSLEGKYNFIINGKTYSRDKEKISYKQVVDLAGFNTLNGEIFTVTYSFDPDAAGSMTEGDIVNLVNGINFNVQNTNKA